MRLCFVEVLFALSCCSNYWLQAESVPQVVSPDIPLGEEESVENESGNDVGSVSETNGTLSNTTTDVIDYASC